MPNPKRQINCPTCGHRFGAKSAPWRDYDAPKVECPEMADALGLPLIPKVPRLYEPGFVSRVLGRPPADRNSRRWKRVCPRCRVDLPDLIADGDFDSLRFTFVAGTHAGKSNFFTSLVRFLDNSSVPQELGITLVPGMTYDLNTFQSVSSMALWKSQYESYHYPAADPDGSPRPPRTIPKTTALGLRPPLIFRLQFSARSGVPLGPGEDIRPVDLLFYDHPGELYGSERAMLQFAGDVLSASGIIFLIDPMVCGRLRRRAGGPHARLNPNTDLNGPQTMVQRVRSVFELENRASPTKKLGVDAAFVLAKDDLLRPSFADDNPHAPGLLPADHRGGFDLDDVNAVSADIRGYLQRSDLGGVVGLAEANFTGHKFFSASALGRAPVGPGGELDGPPDPHRVAEPLFWLLHRRGYLPAKARPAALTRTTLPRHPDEDDA